MNADEEYKTFRTLGNIRQRLNARNYKVSSTDSPLDSYLICPASLEANECSHAVKLFKRTQTLSTCTRCNLGIVGLSKFWKATQIGLSFDQAAWAINNLSRYISVNLKKHDAGSSLGYGDEVYKSPDLYELFPEADGDKPLPTGRYIVCSGSLIANGVPHMLQLFHRKQTRALCQNCGIAYYFRLGMFETTILPDIGMNLKDAAYCVNLLYPFISQLSQIT